MKILHVTNNYPTNEYPIFGIFVKEQIESLNSKNISNYVFFINSREKGKIEYIKSIFKLRKLLNTNEFDIIHCHHVFSAIILILTLKMNIGKKVLSYQNEPRKEGGELLFRLIKLYFNAIIVKINHIKYKSKKVKYIPNGVNTEFFYNRGKDISKKALKLDKDKKYVLFMDSYNKRKQKRIDRFNKVINILNKEVCIEKIILTNTERELVPLYMSSVDLHIITSDFEGSPNSVKECIACNTKVVSTPVGDIEGIIGDIEGCYISKSFSEVEIAELVVKSLKYGSINSRNKIFEKGLDLNNTAIKIENLYKELLDTKIIYSRIN